VRSTHRQRQSPALMRAFSQVDQRSSQISRRRLLRRRNIRTDATRSVRTGSANKSHAERSARAFAWGEPGKSRHSFSARAHRCHARGVRHARLMVAAVRHLCEQCGRRSLAQALEARRFLRPAGSTAGAVGVRARAGKSSLVDDQILVAAPTQRTPPRWRSTSRMTLATSRRKIRRRWHLARIIR
jgi:hypothetical protein